VLTVHLVGEDGRARVEKKNAQYRLASGARKLAAAAATKM